MRTKNINELSIWRVWKAIHNNKGLRPKEKIKRFRSLQEQHPGSKDCSKHSKNFPRSKGSGQDVGESRRRYSSNKWRGHNSRKDGNRASNSEINGGIILVSRQRNRRWYNRSCGIGGGLIGVGNQFNRQGFTPFENCRRLWKSLWHSSIKINWNLGRNRH